MILMMPLMMMMDPPPDLLRLLAFIVHSVSARFTEAKTFSPHVEKLNSVGARKRPRSLQLRGDEKSFCFSFALNARWISGRLLRNNF
jgi:hypothetical protein